MPTTARSPARRRCAAASSPSATRRLIDALYDGAREADISTEVTFEDGRKGMLAARVKIRDLEAPCQSPARHGEGGMRAPTGQSIAAGEVLLVGRGRLALVRRREGGHAASRSTSARARSAPSSARTAPARPRCSTSSTASTIRSTAASRSRARPARRMRPYDAALGGIARTFQNVALFKGMSALDNIMAGRTLKMRRGFFWQLIRLGPALRGGDRAPPARRGDHRLPQDPAHPQGPGRQAALRLAEAGRARPRARHGARSPAARRADGGDEPRGEGGHVALHPRRQRALRHHDRADRARHGRGDGPVRSRRSCSTTASRSPTARRARCRPTRP